MSNVPSLRFKEFNSEWEKNKLGHFIFEHKERNYDFEFDKDNVLSVSKEYGIVNQIKHLGRSYAGKSVLNYHIVRKNDIVYTKSPLANNPYGIIKVNKDSDGIVSTLYAVYRCKKNMNSYFLDYYFSLDSNLNRYLRPLVQKGAKNDMKINNQKVLIDYISVPKNQEQEKIVLFLNTIENKISLLENKITLLQKYKVSLMQKIFTQKIRFTNDNTPYKSWQTITIGDVFSERVERQAENLELLSVTINNGIQKRNELHGTDNSSNDKSNYKRVYVNDIVYNSMRMWQGASGASTYDGIVSPAYTVLKSNKEHNSKFFSYLFKTTSMIHTFERNSQGLTSDTWNLKYPQLSKIKISIPTSLAEEIQIAKFLQEIDKKINITSIDLIKNKKFKKGLLQRMFV